MSAQDRRQTALQGVLAAVLCLMTTGCFQIVQRERFHGVTTDGITVILVEEVRRDVGAPALAKLLLTITDVSRVPAIHHVVGNRRGIRARSPTFALGSLKAWYDAPVGRLWIVDIQNQHIVASLDMKTRDITGIDDAPPDWAALDGGATGERVAPVLDPMTAAEIKRGITLEELEGFLRGCGDYEFTVEIGADVHACVGYPPSNSPSMLYFVFSNGLLRSIIEPPPFEWQSVLLGDGTRYEFRKPEFTERRVAIVLNSKDLSQAQILESVNRRRPKKRPRFFNNVWPLDFITFPARAVGLPLTLTARQRARDRNAHFDPSKVSMSMSVHEVNEIYGKPTRIHNVDGRTLRVYGNKRYPATWVAVQFQSQRAIGVFKNHFFDRTWIVSLPAR